MHQTHFSNKALSTCAALLATLTISAGCISHEHSADYEIPRDSYAIVVSSSVFNDTLWHDAIIMELEKKYPGAPVLVWTKSVEEVRDRLAKLKPTFTAFAVKPGEAGVHFTIAVNHLARALDDDPYTDTFWGIITGYDAESARAVAAAGPIAIERALDCSGCDLTSFKKAWRYTEDHRGTMNTWDATLPDAKVQDVPCDTDNTQGVLERLQKDNVQFLSTSGHATQHDWQMGYCGPNMVLTHKEGHLVAVNTKKEFFRANSSEPKVYFANGNCLIGDVDQRDCMALSWMRDGGVRQMMGYTVTTWFGAQGWGTLGLFTDTAGLTTAAEAFHFTNVGIVDALEDAITVTGAEDIRQCRLTKIEKVNRPLTPQIVAWFGALSQEQKAEQRKFLEQIIGNLHDRDTVCFYGDPALSTRIADGRFTLMPPVYHALKRELTLTLRAEKGERDGAIWFRLPGGDWSYSAANIKASEALGQPDLCLDNMIRFPKAKLTAGKTYTVVLNGATQNNVEPCPHCARK